MRITIFSKKECHLCDQAKVVLVRLAKEFPLEIEEVDIEQDPEAFAKYQYEIPVVLVEGRKLFKYRIDEPKLRKLLTTKSGSTQSSTK